MKQNLHYIALLLLLSTFVTSIIAQEIPRDSADMVIIKIKGGKKHLGIIQSEDDEAITILDEKNQLERFLWEDIKSVKETNKNKYWNENLFAHHYLAVPSGYALDKGQFYYENRLAILNMMGYGFTDWLSIKAGLVPFFIFDRIQPSPFFLNTQFNFPIRKNKLNFGAGILYINSFGGTNEFNKPGLKTGENTLIYYGTLSIGSRNRNISVSLGTGKDGFDSNQPNLYIGTISSIFRINNKNYLITENYLLADNSSSAFISSLGARYATQRLALDYSVAVAFDGIDGFVALFPWIGITINLNKIKNQ